MDQENRNVRFGISGSTLKIIAIVTMLIDHLGAALIEQSWEYLKISPNAKQLIMVDRMFRTIGRVSFPIFCFLLVEGFCHTRNMKKYAGRLMLFAFISEIPFDLAFSGEFFNWQSQNVFFTLLIGLIVLIFVQRYQGCWWKQCISVCMGCFVAYLLKTDYDVDGVLLIVILYILHKNRLMQVLSGGALAAMESRNLFGAAALGMIPIGLYNGQRGRIKLKYFFYWFYPVHLIILYMIRVFWIRV